MLLEHPNSKLKFYFDIFMFILVLTSVLILLYEVKHADQIEFLEWFIHFTLIIFIIEYLLRLWICSDNHKLFIESYENSLSHNIPFSLSQTLLLLFKKKLEYILSPLAIIDLLAIIPSYRPLRFLRFFLLFRILKLFRYARSIKTFSNIITEKKFELFTLAIFASFVIFTGSAAFYIFETSHNPNINTLYDAVYWAIITMGTVGYGDIAPSTKEGMFVAMTLTVLGVATFAFLTSILVSSFQSKLVELKENRTLAYIEQLRNFVVVCGYGRVGEVVAKMLLNDGYNVVIIDTNQEKIQTATKRGYLGIVADASSSKTLTQIGFDKCATHIICATSSDELNIFITLTARSLSKNAIIIARVIKNSHKKKYFLAGANEAFSAEDTIGLMAEHCIDRPISYTALYEMLSESTGITFETIVICSNSTLEGKTIDSIKLYEKRLLLFGILRAGQKEPFIFNPPSDFILKEGDTLILMGRKYHINTLRKENDKGAMCAKK